MLHQNSLERYSGYIRADLGTSRKSGSHDQGCERYNPDDSLYFDELSTSCYCRETRSA